MKEGKVRKQQGKKISVVKKKKGTTSSKKESAVTKGTLGGEGISGKKKNAGK